MMAASSDHVSPEDPTFTDALYGSEREKQLLEKTWMVKPCFVYEEDYRECKRIRGRFQQYYVEGKMKDCSMLFHMQTNCKRWTKESNFDAL
ncbi:unnamed protein product, partial [Darwinula stevensoni]